MLNLRSMREREMDFETRLARLEAEADIRDLVSRYSFDIDDREIDRIALLFTEDAAVRSADGMMNAIGRAQIISMYKARFDVLGPGAHYTHDLVLDLSDLADGEASGRVSGHAELARNGAMMVCALRYEDRYRRTADGWKIQLREISFLYYVPVDQYPGILLEHDRNRAYAEPKPADFPEGRPTWEVWLAGV